MRRGKLIGRAYGAAMLCGWTVAILLAAEPASAGARRKVLFIGIDGCRFDALQAARTPHLDRLIEGGCFDSDCQILGPRYQGNDTVSGPGWSSILTGVWADRHGVNNNSFEGKQYDKFPHFFTRLKERRPEARAVSIVTWLPIQTHIVSGADTALQFEPDGTDYRAADAAGCEAAAKILSQEDPDVLFCYIGEVDETGHRHGFHPSVKEYIHAIEEADALVGRLLDSVAGRKTADQEQWLVLVTSDHGGRGTGHGGGHEVPEIRNSFVIVSGPAAQRGRLEEDTYLVDVPVTALAYLGVEPRDDWQLDGRPIGLKPAAEAQ